MTDTSKLPNKEEFAAIQTALIEREVPDIDKAMTAAIDDFGRGRFSLETIDGYLVTLKATKPALFTGAVTPDMAAADAAQAELAEKAFVHRSAASRAALLKQLGPEATDVLARSYGLKGHADFKVGKKPGGDDTGGDGDKAKPSNNPFLRLRDKNGAINPAVQEQINRMIVTPGPMGGTRFVSGLAKSAGVTLDGRPLRR